MENIHSSIFFNQLIRDAIFSHLPNKDVVNFRLVCREFNESAIKELDRRPPQFRLKLGWETMDACVNFKHLNWVRLVDIICDQTWSTEKMNDFYNKIHLFMQMAYLHTESLVITHEVSDEEGLACFPWDKLWNAFEFPKLQYFELSATFLQTEYEKLSEKLSVKYVYLHIGVPNENYEYVFPLLSGAFDFACRYMQEWLYYLCFSKCTHGTRKNVFRGKVYSTKLDRIPEK